MLFAAIKIKSLRLLNLSSGNVPPLLTLPEIETVLIFVLSAISEFQNYEM